MALLVCRTCPRYDRRRSGEFGRRVTSAIAGLVRDGSSDIAVRGVLCLGGCPRDGVAAIDGPGKARVRFADLNEDDAADLLAAAAVHERCASGEPSELDLSDRLRGRISSVTLKRGVATSAAEGSSAARP
jgi:predicted metal-binding protein